MAYIISSVLRKAFDKKDQLQSDLSSSTNEELWKYLMLLPKDYGKDALYNEVTRDFMDKINFIHGG